MTRTLYAWERDGKFYLSAFGGANVHINGKTPAQEHDTKESVEAEVSRRGAGVVWEYLPDGH